MKIVTIHRGAMLAISCFAVGMASFVLLSKVPRQDMLVYCVLFVFGAMSIAMGICCLLLNRWSLGVTIALIVIAPFAVYGVFSARFVMAWMETAAEFERNPPMPTSSPSGTPTASSTRHIAK